MAWSKKNRRRSTEQGPPLPPLLDSTGEALPADPDVLGFEEDRGDIAVRAHCLRVATWSSELAGAIGLSESDRKLVEQAAIAHHFPEILVDDQAHARLLAEMHMEASGRAAAAPQ